MNQFEIVGILNTLGIKHESHPSKKGWLDIICPYHNDKNFGNAGINVYTGVINCYKCGATSHINKLWKDRFSSEPDYKYSQLEEQPIVESKISKYITDNKYNFTHTKLKPEKYYYTQQRNFTPEFVDHFNIRHALSSIYSEYLIIPIHDKEKDIYEFEARKLLELETLRKYFNRDLPYDRLKKHFKNYVKKNNIYLDKEYNIHFNDEIIEDEQLLYLLDKKVKYISGSRITETIFNIDELDREQDLYEVEGSGSLSKLWSYVSKNCTCTFGSNVSENQIKYLKQFKKIISIPDPDSAGFKKMRLLNSAKLKNHYIIDIKEDDTHSDYVDIIKSTPIITSEEYFKKYWCKYPK